MGCASRVPPRAARTVPPIRRSAAAGPLAGKKVLVTSGPTHEPIDPVRYIANRSSGKQGYAIASALADAGAETVLVSGPSELAPPPRVKLVRVETARQMWTACEAQLPADIAVCTAAVSPYGESFTTAQAIQVIAQPTLSLSVSASDVTPEPLNPHFYKNLRTLSIFLYHGRDNQNPNREATLDSSHKRGVWTSFGD